MRPGCIVTGLGPSDGVDRVGGVSGKIYFTRFQSSSVTETVAALFNRHYEENVGNLAPFNAEERVFYHVDCDRFTVTCRFPIQGES